MITSKLRIGSVLLVSVVASICAHSQVVDSLSPNLSSLLTTDPEVSPSTTLAIDLLLPQRPFIFDPTGASVSANAFNPEIYSATLSSPGALTDTQIRDSSQSGHISPYASAAARLGLNSSGGDDIGNPDAPHISSGFFRGALGGENGDQNPSSTGPYQSSWGSSSSFGSDSEESSWGTGRLNVGRLGRKQPGSSTARPGLNSDATTTASSSSGPYAGGSSVAGSAGYAGRYANSGSSGGSANGLTATNSGSSPNSSGSGYAMGSRSKHSSSDSAPGQVVPVDTTADNTVSGSPGAGRKAATGGPSKDKNAAAVDALTYFPQAAYSQPTFGESPFSSPSGIDELHFLNPNIFAATAQGRSISLSEAGNAGPTKDSLRQAFVAQHTLATSTSHYGLATHPAGSKLKNDKLTSQKRTHLKTSILDSENQ
jgi:hypothetical protein